MSRPALLLLLLVFCAQPGWAQNIKLTSGGIATLAGNVSGGVMSQSPDDAPLSTVANFGDVGPGNTSAFVCLTQPISFRSKEDSSSLHAAVTAASFGAGPGDLRKSDIGMGFQNLRASGPDADLSTTLITPAFAADPCAASKDADGIPAYSATLASLGTAAPGTTVVQSSGRISQSGGLDDAENRALIDLRLAIAPQAFTAGSFSTTLTITITSP